MKKLFFALMISAALLCAGSVAFAQEQQRPDAAQMAQKWQDRIESEKIAFLTREMSLTPEEAQSFWPVYNQAQKAQRDAVEASFKAFGALDNAIREGKTGKDIDTLLKAYNAAVTAREASSSQYLKEYLKVLSPEKVAKLYIGEERFRQSQIHRLRKQPAAGDAQPQNGWQPWGRKKDSDKQ